jgi:hypothetical protein
MGELYLCSRTEFARAVDMDTGRKVAIIGAPSAFPEWIERLLPADSCIVSRPQDLAGQRELSIIIWWLREPYITEADINVMRSISKTGDLWIVVPRLEENDPVSFTSQGCLLDRTRIIMLTPEMDLVPVSFA